MGRKGKKVLRFDMPYTSEPPPMRSEELGFNRVVERRSASQAMDVTVLDTPDNRLLRAGIVVAHRVVDGFGEWYLSSENWDPWLPSEAIEELDATAELPPLIARVIRPFIRRATVGPVATLRCERSGYWLRGAEEGQSLAEIRDERVTVRRAGVTTARYREATITPTVKLSPQQVEFILTSMSLVSATQVEAFPTLQQRLGPPATGLTDFPAPQKFRKGADLEDFVTAVFAVELRQMVESVLAFEVADEPAVGSLATHLEHVRRDVRGLSTVLEPEWRARMEGLTQRGDDESPRAVVERSIDVIDALVTAVRAPKLGDASHHSARTLLFNRAERAAFILAERCRTLTDESTNTEWVAALSAAEQLLTTAEVGAHILGKTGRTVVRRLRLLTDELRGCLALQNEPEDIDSLTPQQAYQEGRRVERENCAVVQAREAFVSGWPSQFVELRQLMDKVRQKL